MITGSAEEAEDAAQEGFIRAYRSIDRFRPGAPFRPWLLKIVANVARTRRGRTGRLISIRLAAVDVEAIAGDVQATPEALAIANEQLDELLTAIGELRQDDQRVIALRYFLDLSEVEMAGVLRCARGTVKSRLSRALVRLRQVMLIATEEAPHE
ncbi:MAG: sigma-70 family RNA polymerase sigma factor [Chloroflexota bacterium]|nr:sigma-70 family RNA polymerase sigma factor [Chloroflexota bacterium]